MDLNIGMGTAQADAKPVSSSESVVGSVTGSSSGSGSKRPKIIGGPCGDCQVTATPLWRAGPAGPKTLCNACGIKFNKKKRERRVGVVKTVRFQRKAKKKIAGAGEGGAAAGLEELIKQELLSLGVEVILKGKNSDKILSKLKEEERAALILLSMTDDTDNRH